VVALVDEHATFAAERALSASTAGAQVTLDPEGSATLKLARLTLRCGAAEVTIGDGRVTVKAPTVVAHGAMGKVQVDAQGATTAGQEVKASAVLLNEVKGAMVIISDSPGNLAPLTADKHRVPDGKGTVK
jgi:phage baseplate assembly protein gpV